MRSINNIYNITNIRTETPQETKHRAINAIILNTFKRDCRKIHHLGLMLKNMEFSDEEQIKLAEALKNKNLLFEYMGNKGFNDLRKHPLVYIIEAVNWTNSYAKSLLLEMILQPDFDNRLCQTVDLAKVCQAKAIIIGIINWNYKQQESIAKAIYEKNFCLNAQTYSYYRDSKTIKICKYDFATFEILVKSINKIKWSNQIAKDYIERAINNNSLGTDTSNNDDFESYKWGPIDFIASQEYGYDAIDINNILKESKKKLGILDTIKLPSNSIFDSVIYNRNLCTISPTKAEFLKFVNLPRNNFIFTYNEYVTLANEMEINPADFDEDLISGNSFLNNNANSG